MFRAIDKWLAGYLESVRKRPGNVQGPKHLLFCIADHFEPFQDNAAKETALGKVENWRNRFPAMAGSFRDADGVWPQYTFFYPQEEYDADCLEKLAEICGKGFGEVEIQLHHRNDTPAGFQSKLEGFRDILRNRHGLLGEWKEKEGRKAEGGNLKPEKDEESFTEGNEGNKEREKEEITADGRKVQDVGDVEDAKRGTSLPLRASVQDAPAFGFIHGNWALCNSRPDGDWCGVNEELGILRRSGCYADFTFPSAPSPTQPRMVNTIYRAEDTPGRARACDRGRRVKAEGGNLKPEVGREQEKTDSSRSKENNSQFQVSGLRSHPFSLMLITGPLAPDWGRRKWGLLPRLENGAITAANPPSRGRLDLWTRQHIHVGGRPEWLFVKAYTHGCRPENMEVLLGEPMRRFFECLTGEYNDGGKWVLHFVTAREMYNIVRAAEDGKTGNPGNYRDYEISAPPAGKRTEVR